ncbi:MAG: hypothetical protein IJ688_11760 [Treponema sp.]|nr:hypothetical protein [Treponema sp.]
MKDYLCKQKKKTRTFLASFPRLLAMGAVLFFLKIPGFADQTWPTDGQKTVASDITLDADIERRGLTLLVKGTVTINLEGHSLTVGTLLVGGDYNGDEATYLTVTGGTLTVVGTYDVANNVDTSLTIAEGAKVVVIGTIYLNRDSNVRTTITGSGTLDLSSASQNSQYSIPDIGAVIDSSSDIEVTPPADYEGSDYYWTGDADLDWTNKTNWTVDASDHTKHPAKYPGEQINSKVTFPSSISSDLVISNVKTGNTPKGLEITNSSDATVTLTLASGAEFNSVNIKSGKINVDGAFTVSSLTNAGSLTASDITASSVFSNSTIKTQNLSVSNIKFGDDSTKAGTLEFTGSGSLNVISGTANSFFNDIVIDSGATLTLESDIAVYGNWTNNNTSGGLSAGTSKVVSFAGSGKSVGGKQTFADVEFTGSGNTVSGENTFGDVTISGATNFADDNIFGNINISAATSFDGNNTFTNFTSTSSGTTLTFGDGKTQTVTGKLTLTNVSLSGSSTLITQGTGSTYFEASSLTLDSNIKIKTASNASVIGGQFTISDSSLASGVSIAQVFNNGWKISDLMTNFEWTGSTDTDWNSATNWDIGIVPGGTYTSDASVTIPNTTNKPELNLSMTIKSLSVGSSSDNNAKLTLAGSNNLTLTAASSPLTIYGTVNYSGEGRILNSTGSAINDITHNGTVEYSGSAQTIGDTNYANLIVSGSASSSTDLKVSGNFANNGTTSLANTATFTGAVTNTGTITNTASTTFLESYTGTSGSLIGSTSSDPTIEFKGDVIFGTFTANGDTVKLSGSATQSLTTNNQTFHNIVFENTSASGVSVNGNLTSDGTITNNTKIVLANSGTMSFAAYSGSGSISTSGASIISNAGTATTISSLTASGDCTITNNGSAALSLANLTATSGKTLTLASAGDTAPLTVGNASWNSCNLTITDSGTVALSSSTSTNPLASLSVQSGSLNLPSETYATALSNAAGATVTATGPSPLTVAGPLTNAGSLSIASSSTSPITVNGNLNNSGSLTISDTSANPGSVTISGTITNAGSLTLANASLTAAASWTTTNTGSFTCGTSTVNFTGAEATIAGNQTFYNANFSGANARVTGNNTFRQANIYGGGITFSGSNTFTSANFEADTTLSADNTFTTFTCNKPGTRLTFGDGSRQRIQAEGSTEGTFTVTGSESSPVILASQTDSTDQASWWILDMEIPKNASVHYAGVSSSYAESDISGLVFDSHEEIEGSTDGWFNFEGIFYWTGSISSDWTDRLNWSLKRNSARPPAVPPVINNASATIIHIASESGSPLDFTQITEDISLNNLIIETNAIIAKAVSANYILLRGGNTRLSAALTADKDIILLGENYSTKDQQTGVEGIYDYPGECTLTRLSDSAYSASLTCSAGASIKAKNFYANGITADSSDEWSLNLPSNFNQDTTFALAYFCDFTDSACKVASTDTKAALKIVAEETSLKEGYKDGWDWEDFIIEEACTSDDDVLKVKFNRPLRNKESLVSNNASKIIISTSSLECSGIYTDSNCSTTLPSTDSATSAEDCYDTVYLKSPESWNTDADGSSSGAGSDKSGITKSIIPAIGIQRNSATSSSFITDLYGKRLRHYAGGTASYSPYSAITDGCSPVLIAVLTGQELHDEYDSTKGEASQHSYDAHNFLEFRYSEEIVIEEWGSAGTSGITGTSENIPVTDSLGLVKGSLSDQENLTLAGLCQIQKGKIHTASQGSDDKYINAFYIPSSQTLDRIRLSIAGLTEGSLADRSGNAHKKWKGYIESAVQPSGTVTFPSSDNSVNTGAIKDKAGNIQSAPKSEITVDSTENGLYGKWDLTEPAFAPLRLEASSEWAEGSYNEALGNSLSGELYINEIEFHLFDNKPSYSQNDEAAWHTERGWIYNNSSDTLYTDYSYAADIIGGARGFDSDSSRRTGGGIRYSSLADAVSAFKYTPSQLSGATPDLSFQDTLPYKGAKGTLFTGSSETRRAADRHDGLYFGLEIESQKYTFADSFTVSYDDTKGFVTDLAGNRLRSATVKTIDRTPPSYDITISPVNQKEVCLVFNKNIATDSSKIKYYDSDGKKVQIQESFASLIPSCFEIITIDSTGSAVKKDSLQPDTSVPAKIQHISSDSESGQEFTIITLRMEENISYDDIKNCFIRIKYPDAYGEFSTDPITGIENARVTFIQDEIGNYMNMYEAHALSEFAVNVIEAQYAYTSDSQPDIGWSVHDWNADQQSFGTLPLNHDYDIVASTAEGVEGALLCFATSPDQASVSTKINKDLNLSYRIWLPALGGFSLPAFTFTPSQEGSYKSVSALQKENQLIHTIPSDMTSEITAGSQVLFLYALTDSSGSPLTICNIPEYDFSTGLYDVTSSNRIPLFALRQLDFSDLLSLDLWSFRLKGLTLQRGGITIFNNVINVSKGESLTLQVDMAEEGRLNVMVMTLDGNIIEYLSHGNVSAGSHHFTWDGKNRRGSPVARGLYFIRVTGSGIDETRKVMVVR